MKHGIAPKNAVEIYHICEANLFLKPIVWEALA